MGSQHFRSQCAKGLNIWGNIFILDSLGLKLIHCAQCRLMLYIAIEDCDLGLQLDLSQGQSSEVVCVVPMVRIGSLQFLLVPFSWQQGKSPVILLRKGTEGTNSSHSYLETNTSTTHFHASVFFIGLLSHI